MVKASLRLPFWAARGVELWDDTDNEVEAVAYDKAGNDTTVSTQANTACIVLADEAPSFPRRGYILIAQGQRSATLGTESQKNLTLKELHKFAREKRTRAVDRYIWIDVDADVDVDYTYDDNGCMATVDAIGTAYDYTYIYDYENRLVEVQDGAQATVCTYQYDALGRRVKTIIEGSPDEVTRYIYDGADIIEEYVWDGVGEEWDLTAEYVHGAGIDSVLKMDYHHEAGTEDYYYHRDGMGSVSELTDNSTNLVQAYEYDAWGNPTIYDPDATTGAGVIGVLARSVHQPAAASSLRVCASPSDLESFSPRHPRWRKAYPGL